MKWGTASRDPPLETVWSSRCSTAFPQRRNFRPFQRKGVVNGHAKADGTQVEVVSEQDEMNGTGKVAREPYWLAVMGTNQLVVGFNLEDLTLAAVVQMTDKAFCVPVVEHRIKRSAVVAEQGVVGHDKRCSRRIRTCREGKAGSLPDTS